MNFNSNVIISEENYKYYFANTNSTYEEPNGLIRQIQIVIRAANERVIIPHSGKHESAGRKTSIRGEENTNPRKERSNSPKERISCRI